MSEAQKYVWTDALQLEPRLDAEFYQAHFLAAEQRLKTVPVKRFHTFWRSSNRIYIGIAGFTEKSKGRDYTPYIRPTDVGPNGEIDWSHIAWCYAEWLDGYSGKGCAHPGDLLVEVKGNTRRAAVVDNDVPKNCIVSGSFWRIGLKDDINPRFVLAFLLSETGQLLKRRWVSNSVISWIDPHSFRRFLIPFPDRRIQDYIGAKVELAETCRAAVSKLQTQIASELNILYSGVPPLEGHSLATGVQVAELDSDRIDAWHYQRHYIQLSRWLRDNSAFVELTDVAGLAGERWSPATHGDGRFKYIEIADVDPSTGHVGFSEMEVAEAPSRARKRVRTLDVLVSTVRPNRSAVGLVPGSLDGAVATTGFAVVRAKNEDDAYFLEAVLRHPVSIAQMMRWNTGSAYPAIEERVLLEIWVPGAKSAARRSLGQREKRRCHLLSRAVALVNEAKADVEALIEGALDTKAILSGKLKPPTEEEVLGA